MPIPDQSPRATIQRLVEATAARDVDRIVACFAEDYSLEAPAHPHRSFRGNAQVRSNWTQIFAAVPDHTTTLSRLAVEGDSVWTEWEMSGVRRDGSPHLLRGVFIF